MTRLYLEVRAALGRFRPGELRSLADDHEELIAQFIEHKVLRLGRRPRPHDRCNSAPTTVAALRSYYRRFLVDRLRHGEQRLRVYGEGGDREAATGFEGTPDDGDVRARITLYEHGLAAGGVLRSAQRFIERLERCDRILLIGALSARTPSALPLARLADHFGIRGWQRRAAVLGLTRSRDRGNGTPFGRTSIGQWIETELGLDLVDDNVDAVRIVIEILAAVALVRASTGTFGEGRASLPPQS